jgi:PAS domain S-box-containing protein
MYGDDLVPLSTFAARAFPLPGDHVGVAFENTAARHSAPTNAGDSEALSAAILNNVGACIFLKDTSYRYTYVNRQVVQLLGRPAEDLLGRTDREFFPPEVFAEIMKSDRAVVERGERIEREESGLMTPEGPRALWTVKLPLRDSRGVISGLVGIATDVTELERAKATLKDREARLLESEERFRVAQELSPDGFTILRPLRSESGEVIDFAWVYENRTIARLNGTNPQTIVGKRLLELFPAHKGTSILEAYVRVAVTGEQQVINEVPVGHLISSPTWLRLVVVPAGADIAVLAQDITDRKRAQEELHRSEALYRRMFHSNPQPMWVYDLETMRFLAVNDAAVGHYGYSRDEFLAMTIADIRPPADVPRLYKNLEALPADGVDQAGVWRHLTKDGTVIEVEITSHLLEFEGRRSELVLAHDITARQQVERALRESNVRLKKVLEIETVGVMFWDLSTGRMTDANDTFLNMMGYSREDLQSRPLTWETFTPPEYVEASLAEIEKFYATGRVGPYEKEYLRKDGTRLWLLFAGSSLGGDSAVEFCVDISARMSAQAALRQLALAVQQSPESIVIANLEGEIEYVNDSFLATSASRSSAGIHACCSRARPRVPPTPRCGRH